jgi:RNA polymerase sigma-70 factor (ECF subfamily)
VSAWLFGILRNIVRKETGGLVPCINHCVAFDWEELILDTVPPPDEQVVKRVEAQRVRAALALLSSHDRDLLQMHYFDGLTAVEIGVRLKVPAATVRVWLHRARKAAEQILAPSRGKDDL